MKHKRWNRAFPLAMSFVMLMSATYVPAMAEETESEENTEIVLQTADENEPKIQNETEIEVEGEAEAEAETEAEPQNAVETQEVDAEAISTWDDLQKVIAKGGEIKLAEDITAGETDKELIVDSEKEVTLDLNGCTINRALTEGIYHGYVIYVKGTLTIKDTSDEQTGKITGGYNGDRSNADSAGGGIYVDRNATLNFEGGQITGNKAYSGGGVYVEGTMNMTGGKITDNEATNIKSDGGGGVKVTAGTFIMSNGEISNNASPRYGGGVSVWSTSKSGYFKMTNGVISNNSIGNTVDDGSDVGGGIYVNSSSAELTGGEINGNKAQRGAGIYLYDDDATVTVNGVKIYQNKSVSDGGGIYVATKGKLKLLNGSIYQNNAGGSGAGVYFGADSHGEISNVNINRNAITSSKTNVNGAGISASDDVKISGSPRIEANYNAESYSNDVYLPFDSSVLKVVGTLGENAYIGIAKGGTGMNHYAAVGSDNYEITESDRSKFFSNTASYSVKPLNTSVTGNRVELGESYPVILKSDNVTVASDTTVNGNTALTRKDTRANVWESTEFVFTVTPAEGYAKTSDFCVKYKVSGGTEIEISANAEGKYTLPVKNQRIELYVYGIEQQYTVNFETNGGNTVETQKMFKDSKVTKPEDPVREGYTFAGWYSDSNCKTAWNFGTDTVSDDMTLYAKWLPAATAAYTASGTVTGNADENMYGTIVKLVQGTSVIAVVTTGQDGKFTFANLPAGTYNIIAEKDARSVTIAISITANTSDIALKLPVGKIKIEVKVDENTPNTYVSGLDKLAEDSQYAPSGADVVHIVLNVAAKDEGKLPTETVSAIKKLSGNETLTYLDMDITRYVNGTKKENISDTDPHVQSITIDYDTAGKNISVYRVHDNEASELTVAGSTPTDGTYLVNNGSITIYTTKFSTYAIGYTTRRKGGHSDSSDSSAVATYPVAVKSAANGAIKADKSTAAKGETVTITVTPDKGYEMGKLTVTDKDGKTIPVTAKGNGTYTFTMPASSISVTASFAETDWSLVYRDCQKDSTCPIWPFIDAKTTDWYHNGVHFCLENDLMVGYGNHIFKPNDGTTRAMITAMLWRLNGSPVVNYAMDFDDVKEDAWYTEAIRWAVSEGIANGYGNGNFGPNDTMTREQMVAILWRYAQYKGYDVSVGENTNILSYDDATNVAQYAIPAMQWACGSGMVAGEKQNGSMILSPKGSTTRAQMATMMMRFCAEIVK